MTDANTGSLQTVASTIVKPNKMPRGQNVSNTSPLKSSQLSRKNRRVLMRDKDDTRGQRVENKNGHDSSFKNQSRTSNEFADSKYGMQ